MGWTDERVELLKKLWAEGLERESDCWAAWRRDPQCGDRQGASAWAFGSGDELALVEPEAAARACAAAAIARHR